MENQNLEAKILELERQIVRSEAKAQKYKESVDMSVISPDILRQKAQMDYELQMCETFIRSGAFPKVTKEQAYVLMQAGKGLGMSVTQAMSSLYIVNGNIGFWGGGLVSQLSKHGCKFAYLNESENGVTVMIGYNGETYSERVSDQDQILKHSKAMTFAKKNKMRFHGIRMIANFYLAHLLNGVSVWEVDDIEAAKQTAKGDEWNDLKSRIERAETIDDLEMIMTENRKELTAPKNMELLVMFGSKKNELENNIDSVSQ